MKAQPIPLRIRRQVYARSEGLCELGCGQLAVHIHHRKLRSQGGEHTLDNLVHVCVWHHGQAHANPDLALVMGWIVPSWADPAEVPILTEGAA